MVNGKTVLDWFDRHLLSCAAAGTADGNFTTAKTAKTTVDAACHLESLITLFKLYNTNR
jgi:hypothetical protein